MEEESIRSIEMEMIRPFLNQQINKIIST